MAEKFTFHLPMTAGTMEIGAEPGTREALQSVTTHLSTFGTVIASAGLMLTSGLLGCPTSEDAQGYPELNGYTRLLTYGANEDNLVAVAAVAYLARAIAGRDVIEENPSFPDLVGVIEEWQRQGHSFRDLRYKYAQAVEWVSMDVQNVTKMLEQVRKEAEALDE